MWENQQWEHPWDTTNVQILKKWEPMGFGFGTFGQSGDKANRNHGKISRESVVRYDENQLSMGIRLW